MASATIATKYGTDPRTTWDGTEKIPLDVGGADGVGLASTLRTYTSQAPIVVNSQSAAYPTVLSDTNGAILHPVADNNARTFTIDGSVSYPVGTAIVFINAINTVTIAITTDVMHLAGGSATGSRTLAAYGIATALKYASGLWIISGTNLT